LALKKFRVYVESPGHPRKDDGIAGVIKQHPRICSAYRESKREIIKAGKRDQKRYPEDHPDVLKNNHVFL
jgi:hypothetical protein